MKYPVFILPEAKGDIEDIALYMLQADGVTVADALCTGIEEKCQLLEQYPERGHVVPELKRLGIDYFKEIHYKPYRIIYQVVDKCVFVHCVLDGRRDLRDLLAFRILR
jgi:toxin ParE1/3/4